MHLWFISCHSTDVFVVDFDRIIAQLGSCDCLQPLAPNGKITVTFDPARQLKTEEAYDVTESNPNEVRIETCILLGGQREIQFPCTYSYLMTYYANSNRSWPTKDIGSTLQKRPVKGVTIICYENLRLEFLNVIKEFSNRAKFISFVEDNERSFEFRLWCVLEVTDVLERVRV